MNSSINDFKTEYPGIIFSKEKAEKVITSKGGEIVGEGIKLHVPEGAVKAEDDVKISLQACIGGPFSLPEGMDLVSPVYLIEPPFAFHQSLRLSIDLFIELKTEEDSRDIAFVSSSTKYIHDENNEVHWKFRKYGNSPEFHIGGPGCGKGFMDLRHFCFAGFARGIGMPLIILFHSNIDCCYYYRSQEEMLLLCVFIPSTLFPPTTITCHL